MDYDENDDPILLNDVTEKVHEYEKRGNRCTGHPDCKEDEFLSFEDLSPKSPMASDNQNCQDNSRCSCALEYTKRTMKDGRARWSFFLDKPVLKQYTVNEFVLMMRHVRENDRVMIYLPAMTTLTMAETLASSIQHCASKLIICVAPFTSDSTTAYVASQANVIVTSILGMMEFDTPNIVGHGNHRDAVAGLESDLRRYVVMHNHLRKVGLMSDEEYEHIRKRQGRVCVFSDELMQRIDAFNKRQDRATAEPDTDDDNE